MQYIIILCSFFVVHAHYIVNDVGSCYEKRLWYQNLGNGANELRIDYSTGDLYFRSSTNSTVRFNLYSNELKYIHIEHDINGIAIDQETHDVYIATTHGIYKYTPSTDKAVIFDLPGVYVWKVYFNKYLYYNKGNTSTVYKLFDGVSTLLVDLDIVLSRFVIANEDVVYHSYYNGSFSGVYKQKVGAENLFLYYGEFVNTLATNSEGILYFSTPSEIYQIIKDTYIAKKIYSTSEIHGMAFDGQNNIFYSENRDLYKLELVDCNEYSSIQN